MPHGYVPSSTGAPVPGAKAYFYASESTTPLTTYADATLSTPNSNPVEASQYGIFPDIFLQNLEYRVLITDSQGNQIDFADPVSPFIQAQTEMQNWASLEFTADGNGGVIPAGKTGDQYCPVALQVTSAVCMADKAGDLSIDVWVAPFATNTPPNVSNSITASTPITLSASTSSIDDSLPGWSSLIPAGSQVRFYLQSLDTITRFTAQLNCQPVP